MNDEKSDHYHVWHYIDEHTAKCIICGKEERLRMDEKKNEYPLEIGVKIVTMELTEREIDFLASSLSYIHKLRGVWTKEQDAFAKSLLDRFASV